MKLCISKETVRKKYLVLIDFSCVFLKRHTRCTKFIKGHLFIDVDKVKIKVFAKITLLLLAAKTAYRQVLQKENVQKWRNSFYT